MVINLTRGFTLLELIAVIAIAGILAATATVSLLPSATMQLQSSRDQVLTAFFLAQQRAMTQKSCIRLSATNASKQINILENSACDCAGGTAFGTGSSIDLGGISYPITLLPNQNINSQNFDFDCLGQTTASTLTLSQGSDSVNITVSATGYAY